MNDQPKHYIADQQALAKYEKLREILQHYQKVIVAYSGGVDSVFLLRVTVDCLGADRVLACIGRSESLAQSEYNSALEIARQMGAEIQVVHPREISNPHYRANPADRCFYCKTELYKILSDIAEKQNFDTVLCGTNADDLGDFRPGLQAAKDLNVASPLEQAGLTKNDIRQLSKQLSLPTWDKPAQPCLASRMSYGLEITPDRLKQIEQGEEFLLKLNLPQLRVRHHDQLVRIEVPHEQIPLITHDDTREKIVDFFKKLGFTYVTLDLQGFRSGSGNEVL